MMRMSLAPLPLVYAFRNLFVLQEFDLVLMTLTIENKFLTSKLLNKVIDTTDSVKLFF